MTIRREPGIGPAPTTAPRPVEVTVNAERQGGNLLVLWLSIAGLLLANGAIGLRVGPLLLDLWLGQGAAPLNLPELSVWLLALIAANLVLGIPALLARPR